MALITEFWGSDGVLVVFILIILSYLYMTRNFNHWKKKGVRENSPIPYLGDFKDVILQRASPGQWLRNLYRAHPSAPYVGLYVLDKPFLMIRNPEIMKSILIKDSDIFLDRHATANPNDVLGAANLFLLKNQKWKYLRSKLTPLYTARKLKLMFTLMLEVCSDLDNFLASQNLEGDGAVQEMREITANFTTDLIATTAYGIRANSLNNPHVGFRKHGRKIFAFTTYRGYEFLAMFFAPRLAKLLDVSFFKKDNVPFLRDAFWSILEDREKSGTKRCDLIDLLIELRKSQTEEEKQILELDGDNLAAQPAILFSGGFDSSSKLISLILYELAIHSDIQDKVRKEIRGALEKNNGQMTYEMVTSEVPYLDMALSETMRIYPPLPFLDRVASQDYKVPGHDLIIEKGTPILIPMYGLHTDEKYFPDPSRFDPENFSEEKKRTRRAGVFIPFGEGPHICIGQRLGMIQVKIGVITILSKYEVSPCQETVIPLTMNPKALLTIPETGVFLHMRKLNDQL